MDQGVLEMGSSDHRAGGRRAGRRRRRAQMRVVTVKRLVAVLLLTTLTLSIAGCSKYDKNKKLFMGQCAIVDAMEPACSCMYDKLTAKMSVEDIAKLVNDPRGHPQLADAMMGAAAQCAPR